MKIKTHDITDLREIMDLRNEVMTIASIDLDNENDDDDDEVQVGGARDGERWRLKRFDREATD